MHVVLVEWETHVRKGVHGARDPKRAGAAARVWLISPNLLRVADILLCLAAQGGHEPFNHCCLPFRLLRAKLRFKHLLEISK